MQLNTQAINVGCTSSQLNQGINIFTAQEVWVLFASSPLGRFLYKNQEQEPGSCEF